MKRLAGFWKQIVEGWTVQRIAAVLIVVGLVVFVVGVVNKHCACAGWANLGETLNDVISDFYANVSVDCLSIAFAILVVDRLNGRRAEQELKAQLIREMGSTDNRIALRAVKELRVRGWLEDGTLRGSNFHGANLRGADFSNTNLRGTRFDHANRHKSHFNEAKIRGASFKSANLRESDFENADLREANLEWAKLQGAGLFRADLQNANCTYANLRGAFLSDANLKGAAFSKDSYNYGINIYRGCINKTFHFTAT
jgi:Pentapeptide repeats (9 copies)/Pentapeptide repeats (8 copies)